MIPELQKYLKPKKNRWQEHKMKNVREREWPLVQYAFDHEWLPILASLDSKEISPDLQLCLRNYLIISMVTTIEVTLWNLAARNINSHEFNLSIIIEGEITLPLTAIDKISEGKATKGAIRETPSRGGS